MLRHRPAAEASLKFSRLVRVDGMNIYTLDVLKRVPQPLRAVSIASEGTPDRNSESGADLSHLAVADIFARRLDRDRGCHVEACRVLAAYIEMKAVSEMTVQNEPLAFETRWVENDAQKWRAREQRALGYG